MAAKDFEVSAEPVTDQRFPWVSFAMVLSVALLFRLLQLNHAPHFDEFYHLLAANSLLGDGDMCIAECLYPYDRGAGFTYLVAGAVGLFGSSLVVARLVSVLAGVLLIAGVFWWSWRAAGTTAAWAAALLLGLSPEAIYVSQFIRFYAWHALLIWIGGAGLFFAVHPTSRPRSILRWRLGLAGLGVLALLGALSLQITTGIAIVGIAAWLLLDPIASWLVREVRHRPWRVAASAVGVFVVAATAVLIAFRTDLAADLWSRYRAVNMFEVAQAWNTLYYHQLLLETYPTLYSLLPVAFVIALWKRPAAAKYCAGVFGVALVLQSGGGFKGARFLFYAMPFFFAIWGIALATVLPPLVAGARQAMASWLDCGERSRLAATGGALLLGLVAVSLVGTNSAYVTTIRMATLSDSEFPSHQERYRGRPEWRPAVETIKAISDTADVVVTSASVKALYYLGRSDAELDASHLFTRSGFMPDYSLDWRVGRPVIRSAESMARLLSCHSNGLIVIENHAWARDWGVLPENAEYIAENTEELPLPDGSDLRLFRWGPDTHEASEECITEPLAEARRAGVTE